MIIECANCGKRIDEHDDVEWFDVWSMPREFLYSLCSPSCLVEWAWKCKESQPKLSKSMSIL